MLILGIETSCDDTGVALLEIMSDKFRVLANLVFSQVKIFKKYGGVVPEIAARKHLENLLPLLEKVMKERKIETKDIDAIGVVYGPGLITSLIVGIETAKTLSLIWQKPLVPINHVKAHILANWIEGDKGQLKKIEFPAICLVVSGGHTILALLKNENDIKVIGQTRDDAVGEAFDKVAKILGLGYPGGPIISEKAENADKEFYKLPRPMINSRDYDFSFSGLKTAVKNVWEWEPIKDKENVRKMCAAFQQACIDVLTKKTILASREYNAKSILLGGGVSANKELRKQLEGQAKTEFGEKVKFYQPDLHMTTDNALMVALAAYFEVGADLDKFNETWRSIKVEPNLEI
ncbi:tRNA (adenosine(37)-N6)-threonylcarbamoyltransferase complex transferase subunit TsaD [Candidatus Falkowbacteria bacterium]|nr:tRNA (adenosine(37)-N6)-threonylcarbamoyltransferase complex transferase subunit TsaD [Candidatus Falkowbacteria bacterium]